MRNPTAPGTKCATRPTGYFCLPASHAERMLAKACGALETVLTDKERPLSGEAFPKCSRTALGQPPCS
jgi:hypothetical protein